jgi:CheY-like chemotaxis protein
VKRLVELHGGTVVARSEGEGRGSEFVVRLPLEHGPAGFSRPASGARLEPPPRLEQAPIAARTQRPEGTTRPSSPLSRPQPGKARRVLVVDDNRDSVESLSLLLRLEGYETEVAYAGAEALSKASGFRPDVVLLDLGLPEMNGFDVCRALRLQPSAKPVRIVALTGWGQARDRERAREAGFDAHLVKPVDPAALTALLAGEAKSRPAG